MLVKAKWVALLLVCLAAVYLLPLPINVVPALGALCAFVGLRLASRRS